MAERLYYRDYLALDNILSAQHPRSAQHGSPAHDELLFIIVHQVYELWFKQALFELDSVIRIIGQPYVPEHEVATALFRIERINRILELGIAQFDLLETMTPLDFLAFRDLLHPASGFQSLQFRLLEVRLGLDEEARVLRGYELSLDERDRHQLQQARSQPTLFGAVQAWLERMPFLELGNYRFWDAYREAALEMFARECQAVDEHPALSPEEKQQKLQQIQLNATDFDALFDPVRYAELQRTRQRRLSHRATLAALFIKLYRHYPLLQLPFRFLDSLIRLDQRVSLWRYRHSVMVNRMIGRKVGTGGSSGYDYLLQTTVRQHIFQDLTSLASYLLPPAEIPPLPSEVEARLRFAVELG
ncbi:MAG: tryptophan 2,3-dioxygenase [Candidatus Kapabacteria bacterium]|nr:tryptophan 2,3-dioxygenase [Candidatus Kapabacteria bacterium]MCS7169509.1 tryptophan 2,3-dioxygenase [Candidatus Kapabacteria bacterium]MDW7997521.1 tryptophan 2,3-dioxygenase family protein [Bacteroidota bacterium]MDW8224795.1 tryptophan 2,3-dioxygenase family protein [Bacteroidota bacterium]